MHLNPHQPPHQPPTSNAIPIPSPTNQPPPPAQIKSTPNPMHSRTHPRISATHRTGTPEHPFQATVNCCVPGRACHVHVDPVRSDPTKEGTNACQQCQQCRHKYWGRIDGGGCAERLTRHHIIQDDFCSCWIRVLFICVIVPNVVSCFVLDGHGVWLEAPVYRDTSRTTCHVSTSKGTCSRQDVVTSGNHTWDGEIIIKVIARLDARERWATQQGSTRGEYYH